jgi:hypothetical protein
MKNPSARFSAAVSVALIALGAASAGAETAVQAPQTSMMSPVASLAFPGTFGVPTAVAAKNGTFFAGLTLANPRGGVAGAGADGDFVAGYTVGNPLDLVSLTFGVAVTGLSPFGDAGSFSVTANRLVSAGGKSATFVGASASNLLGWGVAGDRDAMLSAYVSHLTSFGIGAAEVPVQFTAGYGTDNTRGADGLAQMDDGMFAGFGVGVTEAVSFGMSATRTQLNVGTTMSFAGTGVSATIGVLDVADNTDRRQVSLSVAYSF